MEEFLDIVLDYFMCLRNMGMIDSFNGEGCNGDLSCGDYIEIFIRVENNIIEDIGFLVFGCGGVIVIGSMIMVFLKEKMLEEVLNIIEEDIIEVLGGLLENKKYCLNFGV